MAKRALLVIDLQKELQQLYHLDTLLPAVNQRIKRYRETRAPIIFIQHEEEQLRPDTVAWQLFDTLDAQSTDYYIRKTHANAFFQTELQELLDQLEVTELEFCGAQTEYCVDTTLRMAHGLGYSCFMKHGLSTTFDSELLNAQTILRHHEAIWNNRFLTFID